MGYWDAAQQGANVGRMLIDNLYPDGTALDVTAKQQQNEARAQALAADGIKLNQQNLSYQDILGARNLVSADQPVQQMPAAAQLAATGGPQPLASPAADNAPLLAQQSIGPTPRQSALQQLIDTARTQAFDPTKSAGDNDLPAGVSTIPQAQYDAQTAQINDLKTQQDNAGLPGVNVPVDQTRQPTVPAAQASTVPVLPPTDGYMEHLKQLRDYWSGKDDAKATEFNTQYLAAAQQRGQMAAYGVTNPTDMATAQAKMSITAAHADQLEKGLKIVVDAFEKAGMSGVVAMAPVIHQLPGMDKFDPTKVAVDPSARFVSTLLPDGSSLIYDKEHPKEWKLEPASEMSIFRQGYLGDHPGASLSEVSQAYQNFQIKKIAAGKSLNYLNAVPRETMIGVDNNGNAVFKDSHGGAPFTYSNGKQVIYAGPVLGKAEAINLGGNTPDPVTGLTPVQVKANAKALQDPVNIRTVQLINGVVPVGQKFMQAISALPDDTPISAITNVLRSAGIQLNNRQINDFQTFATEFPREAQRAMVGSGQTAQKSLDQQGELFTKAKTVGNLKSSLGIVLSILQDRKEGVLAPVFPPAGYKGPQAAPAQKSESSQIAPVGTQALHNGKVITSDGKGGWY